MNRNICDGCETVRDCMKNGCKPLQPEQVAYQKRVVVQHHGRQRIMDLTIYFDGDKITNVTWDKE